MLVVDSSVLIGYANERDAHYRRAVTIVDAVLTRRESVAITPYIFSEVVTVLSLRVNRQHAVQFGAFLQNMITQQLARMLLVDESLERAAWELFRTTRSKNVSYVDCTTAIVAHYRRATILSFDKDLQQLGRKLGVEVLGA